MPLNTALIAGLFLIKSLHAIEQRLQFFLDVAEVRKLPREFHDDSTGWLDALWRHRWSA